MARKRKKGRCYFCRIGVARVDYKQYETLRRYTTGQGKILPRKRTGTCARHQRQLKTAIKRARIIALLPFVGGD